jgi:hypothetical protein
LIKKRSRSKKSKKKRACASQETMRSSRSKSAKSVRCHGYGTRIITTSDEPCNIALLPLRHAASKESVRPSRPPLKGIRKRADSQSTGTLLRTRSKSAKKLPLIEKLLHEISSKYSSRQVADSCYVARIEKKTMIHDIKMLCTLLINNEETVKQNETVLNKKIRELQDRCELEILKNR